MKSDMVWEVLIIIMIIGMVVVYTMTYLSLSKQNKTIAYYEDCIIRKGIKFGKTYLVEKNGKQFLFQAYDLTTFGISYYWSDLATGEMSKFKINDMDDFMNTNFIEYNGK